MDKWKEGMECVLCSSMISSGLIPAPDSPYGAGGVHSPYTFMMVSKGDCYSSVDNYALPGPLGGLADYLAGAELDKLCIK